MTIDEAINILKGGSVSQKLDKEMQAQEMALKALEESKEWKMQLKELQCEVEDYKTAMKDWEAKFEKAEYEWGVKAELNFRQGVINGLKYAMRCNGVSGGEVRD